MKKIILSIFTIFTLSNCNNGPSQKEYNKLIQQIDSLKTQLDDCQFGASRLYNSSLEHFRNEKFDSSKILLEKLINKYPEFDKIVEAKSLLVKCNNQIQIQQENIDKERKAKELAEKQRLLNATKNMRKDFDDVRKITWYYDKSIPKYVNNNNYILLYMGQERSETPYLRFSIRYSSDDWLFIEKYIIVADDQEFDIYTTYGEVERDNGYGGIWEWYDTNFNNRFYEIVKAIINSKSCKLRYEGKQYHHDRIISKREKIALKNVLDAYESLGGNFNF